MADIEAPLSYGRLTGDFWAVLEDSTDPGEAPDTSPLMGSVTFTPSYRVLRVSHEDVAQRGVAYVDTVTAQVADGVLVDDFGVPGVSLMASTDADGLVFPHDIYWTATFNLVMTTGQTLVSQPEPTQIRLMPGETRSISDFVPTVLESGSNVRVVSVDRETLQQVNSQVDYINYLVDQLGIAVEDGVVKGDKGDKGDTGNVGPIGPYGPPGRSGLVESFNYVKNPVPTSNEGYKATNGTITYSANSLTLTPTDTSTISYFSWVEAVPAYPGTNMYLQFEADAVPTTVDVQSTITFLNAELEPVSSNTLVHSRVADVSAPSGVTSSDIGTYSHMAYTDGPASFAVFSVGLPESVPTNTTLTASRFFFSDTPGGYFSGADTISGYNIRWMGTANNSYSAMTPMSMLTDLTVTSVNGAKGDVTVDAVSIGLGSVENTSDADKPISDATQLVLDSKLDLAGLQRLTAMQDRNSVESMYFKEFSSYATQSVWRTAETFVDVSYVVAPIGGGSMVRLSIPGSITGNSPSSVPTVETSNDGATWKVWRTLEDSVPATSTYTSIDGEYVRATGSLKVIVRELSSTGNAILRLYTVTDGGVVTESELGTFTASSSPYNYPSIVNTTANDGSLNMYYMDVSGVTRRRRIDPDGVLISTVTNLTGLKTNSPAKITRFYGTYVAASADNAATGSPGLLLSSDGITWTHKGFTGVHTWDRGMTARVMSAYPGVSGGKVGVFIDYVATPGFTLNRIFATASPVLSGTITGLTTEPGTTSTVGAAITFPGTLPTVPRVLVSSNDSRLNLGVIALSKDGGTIERFNMGESPSSNATITWTAIS